VSIQNEAGHLLFPLLNWNQINIMQG